VEAGRCDEDAAGLQPVAVLGFADAEPAALVEPAGEGPGEAGGHVLDDRQRQWKLGRQGLEHDLDGRRAAGGRPQDAQLEREALGRAGGWRRRTLAAARTIPGSARPVALPRGERRDPLPQLAAEPVELHQPEAGLVHEVHRPRCQRLERRLGAVPRVYRQHQDAQSRIARQERAKRGEPVHARHCEIQGDDVRVGRRHPDEGLRPVRGLSHHLDAGIRAEHP
jgi:hypothetical protein